MFETYDWYMDRLFDCKVKDFLRMNVSPQKLGSHGQILQWAIPKSVQDIATATRMSEWRVRGCIRRLKRKNFIVEDEKGFRIKI